MIETDASADRVRYAMIASGFAGSTYAEAIRCAAAAELMAPGARCIARDMYGEVR